MKFVISSSVLSTRLQTIGRVIVSKNNLPILDCFLFCIQGNMLTVTASDNETTITSRMDLNECDADITFAVNAKTIQDAIKEIPEQPLEFYINEDNLEITVEYQNGKYNFMGQQADEYPTLPNMNEDKDIEHIDVNAQILSSGINKALFATADDTLRPVMTGIFFDLNNSNLTMVASDGHKLSCFTAKNISAEQNGSFILPKKPAALIKNILSKELGDTSILFNSRNACFKTETYMLNCRLIEGRYPNYNSVIPQNNPNCVTINRSALQSALRRVLIFSNANSALVKIHTEASKMTISSQDIDFSMSAEEVLLCDYSGLPITIGFKGTFLTELLNNIDAEEIVLKLADPSRAGIIVPATPSEHESTLMLLMPMMLND